MVPLGGLLAPCGFCHRLWCYHQNLGHLPAKILEYVDRREGDDRLAKALQPGRKNKPIAGSSTTR